MKKIFLILISIISPFFFNTLVYAWEVSYKIEDNFTDISSYTYSFISSAQSFSSSINKPYFILLYRNNNFYSIFSDTLPVIALNFGTSTACSVQGHSKNNSSYYQFSNNSFSLLGDYPISTIYGFSSSSVLNDGKCLTDYNYLYSNFPIYRNRTDTNIRFYDSSDNEFLYVNSDDIAVPSLIDMYGTPPEPPEPPDSFPLLTSFYTLVVDKLVDICSYITSSYLFLSIFVIFTFYFVILLLRRLL